MKFLENTITDSVHRKVSGDLGQQRKCDFNIFSSGELPGKL